MFHLYPWKFKKTSWELRFQEKYLQQLENKQVILFLAACPLPHQITTARVDTVLHVALLAVAGILLTRVRSKGPRQTVFAFSTQIWVYRFLAGTAAQKIIMQGPATVLHELEWIMRYCVVAGFSLTTYEEQLGWFVCLAGLKAAALVLFAPDAAPIIESVLESTPPTQPETHMSKARIMGTVAPSFIYIVALFAVFSARRSAWTRALATSTCFGKEKQISPAGRAKMGQELLPDHMYDDYYTKSEWDSIFTVVEEEGEKMVRRVAVDSISAENYNWIHTNQVLGQGAYGVVTLVRSKTTGQLCAMKRGRKAGAGSSSSALSSEEAEATAAVAEATILKMLVHPCIVRMVEEVSSNDGCLIVLELCEGGSLSSLIASFGPLDAEAACWFTRNLVDGLDYIHRHAISHSDLKPSNCLLARTPDGVQLKLTDFGASEYKAAPKRRKVVGTPQYMAPELNHKHASRRRMDIWSLGVTTLEMLTGHTLFAHAETPAQALLELAKLKADPALPPAITGAAAGFLGACLRLDPAARPTALALAQHAYVRGVTACPGSSRAIALVLAKRKLDMARVVDDDMMLLPRIRRQGFFWLNPGAVARWLIELEAPFLNPERERLFYAALLSDPLLTAAAAAVALFNLIAHIPPNFAMLRDGHVAQAVFKTLTMSAFVGFLFSPSWFRTKYAWVMLNLLRFVFVIRAIVSAMLISHVAYTPILFLASLAAQSLLVPLVAEIVLWQTVSALKVLALVVQETLQDYHQHGGEWRAERVDLTISSTIIILACYIISILAAFHIRADRRFAFQTRMTGQQDSDRPARQSKRRRSLTRQRPAAKQTNTSSSRSSTLPQDESLRKMSERSDSSTAQMSKPQPSLKKTD